MPSLTQPSHTALRLGAIHKKPRVPNRMYVERTRSSSMWAKAIGLGLCTLHVYDHYELICAEPDPVRGGTRLAKYPSLCQPDLQGGQHRCSVGDPLRHLGRCPPPVRPTMLWHLLSTALVSEIRSGGRAPGAPAGAQENWVQRCPVAPPQRQNSPRWRAVDAPTA